MTPQRDEPTNILKDNPPDPSVPRAQTCEQHVFLAADIAEIKADLRTHRERGDEIRDDVKRIFALLRQRNGTLAEQDKAIALLRENLSHEASQRAVSVSTWRAIGITGLGLFLREGVKRMFGF